jgi:hypothetical protein
MFGFDSRIDSNLKLLIIKLIFRLHCSCMFDSAVRKIVFEGIDM